MKRREFIVAMIVAIGVAQPALALSTKEALVRQLRAQGFKTIKVKRTFLGRTRIIAENTEYRREIVFNPRTGEILRDYWVNLKTGESIFAPDSADDGDDQTGEESGDDDGGDGDTGDDDNDDDDDEDDNDDGHGNDDDHDGGDDDGGDDDENES